MQIAKSKNIYLLSERVYVKLIKIMDTDLAKDVANWIEHKNPSKMLNGVELDNTELVKNFIEITYSYGNSSRTRKQESLFLTEDGAIR